jgi:hypothetical protein
VIRVTASRLALLSECQFFARAEVPWADRDSDDAATGRAVHGMIDHYLSTGELPTTEDARAAAYFAAAKVWIDANRRVGMSTEVAFAYEPSTGIGRELPKKDGHRDYSDVGPTEIAGTADLVSMGIDGQGAFVAVDDWKVSIGPDVLDASAQLGGLALFAARAYGVDRARVRTLKITEAGVEPIEAWLDEWDLEEIAGAISERITRIESSEPTPGPHCSERWCPALAACPATQKDLASAEQLVPVDALVRRRVDMPLTIDIKSPDHAADVLARVRAASKALDLLKSAVTDYVGEGVTLSDGDRLAPTFRTVSRLSSAKLEQLARDNGATDEDIALCFTSAREGAGIKVIKDKTQKRGRAA